MANTKSSQVELMVLKANCFESKKHLDEAGNPKVFTTLFLDVGKSIYECMCNGDATELVGDTALFDLALRDGKLVLYLAM